MCFYSQFSAFTVPDLEKKPTAEVYRPPMGALTKVEIIHISHFVVFSSNATGFKELYMRFTFWYISLPFSTKQQHEMKQF